MAYLVRSIDFMIWREAAPVTLPHHGLGIGLGMD
jgi:hypothetical protein